MIRYYQDYIYIYILQVLFNITVSLCRYLTPHVGDFFFLHGSTPLLNESRQSSVMLQPVAIMTGQTVDEGGWCQRARKHLTLEETGKDSLPLSAISDKAAIHGISAS